MTTNCSECQTPEPFNGSHCRLTDGTFKCCECWNRSVAERKAARKAELAARPKCEACEKRVGTWHVAGVLLCGRCKTSAQRNAERSIPAGLRSLAMFAPIQWSPETVVRLAQGTVQ